MKTIAIDARFYSEAGPGRYVKNIIQHLEKIDNTHKYVIFLRKQNFDLYTPKNSNFTKSLADYPWYSFKEQTLFLLDILQKNPDLLYVPHFNIPVLYPGKLVTAIADIIMHTFSTEKGTTLPKPYFKLKKYVYFLVVAWALIRSKRVIVPSNDVKNDFKKVYSQISDKKYILAYEGVDPDFLNSSTNYDENLLTDFQITKPFLLYIGSMYEHKNISRLIEAFKILGQKYNFSGQLIIVGKKDKFSEEIQKLTRDLNLENSIKMPGMTRYITDAEISYLRSQAELCVFPSLKEGFSLTPLEGMSQGLAAVISDIPCHREVYGDSVIFFDPKNINDMAEKINSVLVNPNLKKELVERGYRLLKKYNWNQTAQITLNVFNEALK